MSLWRKARGQVEHGARKVTDAIGDRTAEVVREDAQTAARALVHDLRAQAPWAVASGVGLLLSFQALTLLSGAVVDLASRVLPRWTAKAIVGAGLFAAAGLVAQGAPRGTR